MVVWLSNSDSFLPIVTELLQLYLAIGNIEIPSSYNLNFRFTTNPYGWYIVDSMSRFIGFKTNSYKGSVICWSRSIPLKVRCFVRRTSLNRILVVDTLAVRRIKVNNPSCSLCDKESETMNYLFYNHEFVRKDKNEFLNGVVCSRYNSPTYLNS